MHYVYMLECKDASVYTGWTVNLEKRLAAHNAGKGAKYTRGRGPVKLLAAWQFNEAREARQFEAHCKRLPRLSKLALIASRLTTSA